MIHLTDSAENYIKNLIKENNFSAIKLSVKSYGCSGKAYDLKGISKIDQCNDEKIIVKDIIIFIEKKSIMFFIGCEVDYFTSKIENKLIFNNKNAKSSCGCGKSFMF